MISVNDILLPKPEPELQNIVTEREQYKITFEAASTPYSY